MCDPVGEGECVPAFTRESKRGPFVQEVEKHDERWSEIELLPIVRVHREPGNVCIQKRGGIKNFTGSAKPHCVRRREGPCFAV